MEFLVVGLNHRTAPLAVRERLSVTRSQLPEALKAMEAYTRPGVILSTCNRSEFYFLEPNNPGESPIQWRIGDEVIKEFLVDYFDVPLVDVERYLYLYRQEQCIRHLFRVASGLDSMVLGESQILGQLRDAFAVAAEVNPVQGPLSRLFHQALRVGKRVRHETGISRNALSVSRACVELAKSLLGNLSQLRVMVIGAGEAGKLAAMALSLSGVRDIVVTNRTYERALELASELSGEAIPFLDMPHFLRYADIVIGATGSPEYVLEAQMVSEAMALRPGRPLFLIDIAVPRDIDPAARGLRDVFLYDVDDLETISESNRQEREQEARRAEEIVSQETERFLEWFRTLEALPTVIALRQKAEEIRKRELNRTFRRLGRKLSPEELASVEAMTRAIVKKLLHHPTVYLKEQRNAGQTHLIRDIFRLGQEGSSKLKGQR